MPTSRNTKWPIHLSLTTDIVLGLANSKEYAHEVDSTVYDIREGEVDLKLSVWGRVPSTPGTYMINQCGLSTEPELKAVANEANCLRMIPEEVDGSLDGNPLLPNMLAYLNGIACIKALNDDKKGAILGGLTYQGKQHGWLS
ncbi:hypothetical protein CF336_g9528 [Tilletia laevis]|nr:hypothetical protein CF336_g9528 [Tilletia laevis]